MSKHILIALLVAAVLGSAYRQGRALLQSHIHYAAAARTKRLYAMAAAEACTRMSDKISSTAYDEMVAILREPLRELNRGCGD